MGYVEFFVLPVVAAQLEDYRKGAAASAAIWLEHGAISVTETVADDAAMGNVTSFPRAVQQKDDETVVCAYITYRDRAHRDAVNEKVFADPRLGPIMEGVPTDGARMFWGGFNVIVQV